jgi:hypothetical protein
MNAVILKRKEMLFNTVTVDAEMVVLFTLSPCRKQSSHFKEIIGF